MANNADKQRAHKRGRVLRLGEDLARALDAPLVEDLLVDDRRDVEERVAEATDLLGAHFCGDVAASGSGG